VIQVEHGTILREKRRIKYMAKSKRSTILLITLIVRRAKSRAIDALINPEVPNGFAVLTTGDQPDIQPLSVGIDSKAPAVFIICASAARANLKKARQSAERECNRVGLHTIFLSMNAKPRMETGHATEERMRELNTRKNPQKISFRGLK
jgi:hypothetical protein